MKNKQLSFLVELAVADGALDLSGDKYLVKCNMGKLMILHNCGPLSFLLYQYGIDYDLCNGGIML